MTNLPADPSGILYLAIFGLICCVISLLICLGVAAWFIVTQRWVQPDDHLSKVKPNEAVNDR